MGRLLLIPWHIGNAQDLTFRAASAAHGLHLLLVESETDARRELAQNLGADSAKKELWTIPESRDEEFLGRVLEALAREDVGMLASGGEEERRFLRLARRREPLFVFLPPASLERCLRALRPVVGRRPATVFFDLTKRTRGKYPLADKVLSMSCERWLKALPSIPWDRVSDLALMVGP